MLLSFIMKRDSDIAQFQDELGMQEKPSTETILVNSSGFLQTTLLYTINRYYYAIMSVVP